MIEAKIIEFAKKRGYESVEYLKDWHGFRCYEPVYRMDNPVSYIGLPLVILVKGNEIRMSTADEAMSMLEENGNVK